MRMTDFRPSQDALRLRDYVLVVVASSLFFFPALGARDLWNPNEPIYGLAVAEMQQRGDWTVPTVNGQVFAEKPILYYWLALVTTEITGEVDEWSLRAPSAVAGVASILLASWLVVPYAGRRRALLTAAVMATQYQVYWASRAVQMDILVLLFTLGALLPLTRMLDFGLDPKRAWALAGLSLGLGFAAKGPVVVVLPGLVIAAYSVYRGRFRQLVGKEIVLGALIALLIASPWYLALWFRGHADLIYEVLIRQNFSRFVDAWDHQQPWWYYLKYVWLDYAPWAWFLPVVLLSRRQNRSRPESSLETLGWLWIVAVIGFFSLSDSKRAPYILPIAPAVALLVAGFVERWVWNRAESPSRVRVGGTVVFALFALLFVFTGGASLIGGFEIPTGLGTVVRALGWILVLAGGSMWWILVRNRTKWSPIVLLCATAAVFLATSIWALPAVDRHSSARDFSQAMVSIVEQADGDLASGGFWRWRSEYVYYGGRKIPNLETQKGVEDFWRSSETPFLLLENRRGTEPEILPPPGAVPVLQRDIGGRTATLYAEPSSWATVLSQELPAGLERLVHPMQVGSM